MPWGESGADSMGRPRRSPGGRSLVWLMMLLIFAIPTVIAYKAYRRMLVRADVAAAVALARQRQEAVERFYANYHALPSDDRQAGLAARSQDHEKSIDSLAIAEGVVTVRFGAGAEPPIAGRQLVFVPRTQGGRVSWACGTGAGTTLDLTARPVACRR